MNAIQKQLNEDADPTNTNQKDKYLFFSNLSIAFKQSLVTSGCIKIEPIPSALQSFFTKVGFDASNLARTGADVIHFF